MATNAIVSGIKGINIVLSLSYGALSGSAA